MSRFIITQYERKWCFLKKKKSLKGFTLIELIVVIAVFGLILAAALSILNPVNNIFQSTYRYTDSVSIVDNVSMYVEDNLRYCNRMDVCDKALIADLDAFRNEKVSEFIDRYRMNDASKISQKVPNEKIYLMKIENPDGISDLNPDTLDLANFKQSGKISLWTYTMGSGWTGYKEWAVNEEFYNDYTFTTEITSMHVGTSSRDFTMNINLFHNDRKAKVLQQISNTNLDNIVSFPLVNLVNGSGKIMEDIYVKNGTDIIKSSSVPRFEYRNTYNSSLSHDLSDDKVSPGNDIYIMFTKTPAIEDL